MTREPAMQLLPLPMAAVAAYFRVLEPEERAPPSQGLLDVVASALSVWIPVYGSRRPGEPRDRLSDDDVGRGRFSGGATQLRFRDGTPPVENLAVAQADLEAAIHRLRRAGVRFSEAMVEPAPRRLPRIQPM